MLRLNRLNQSPFRKLIMSLPLANKIEVNFTEKYIQSYFSTLFLGVLKSVVFKT